MIVAPLRMPVGPCAGESCTLLWGPRRELVVTHSVRVLRLSILFLNEGISLFEESLPHLIVFIRVELKTEL